MTNLVPILFGAFVLIVFGMMIVNTFSKSKWFCIKMGWHRTPIRIDSDGFQQNGECPRCGKSVIQDSQGNWF